jgi:hypothetical protein
MNTHKAKSATLDLINDDSNQPIYVNYDVICIQEPWLDTVEDAKSNYRWHMVNPTNHTNKKHRTRAITLMHK